MNVMSFVIVDESSTPVQNLEQIAEALCAQLNMEFAQEWGGAYTVTVGTVDKVKPTDCGVFLRDTLPEAPGAAGYHDKLDNGASAIYVETAALSRDELTTTLSHECIEAAIDRPANVWCDNGDGTEQAYEGCDRVEDRNYVSSNGIIVSDFLLRSAFDPGASRPFSHLDSLDTWNGLTSGGYMIVRSASSDARDVTVRGCIRAHRLSRKKHFTSRSYRRGVRL